jgi:hypothetical protein
MDSNTSKFATSKIGLAVLGLLTIAIIAGQADANLPAEATASAQFEQSGKTHIILNAQQLERIEELPQVLDTVMAIPRRIKLTVDVLGERDNGNNANEVTESPLNN